MRKPLLLLTWTIFASTGACGTIGGDEPASDDSESSSADARKRLRDGGIVDDSGTTSSDSTTASDSITSSDASPPTSDTAPIDPGSIDGIIPAARRIDWKNAGVPGGIPSWTRVCATVDAATYGKGLVDATGAIQAAVDGCATSASGSPGPGVVSIPAGTYRVDGTVSVGNHSHLVIRGAGADKTTIDARHKSGYTAFEFGQNGVVREAIPISTGGSKGSTVLNLSRVTGLSVGQLIDVSEDNATELVFTNHGSTRDLKQMAKITAISGTAITITPPLIWSLSHNPVVLYSFIGVEELAGLEDMKIDHSLGGSGASFSFDQCVGCWAKGLYSYNPGGYHSYIMDSVLGEVRDSYFNDSQAYGSNNAGLNARGTSNAGEIQGAVTGFKFENNIFDKTFPGIELQNASSGNVMGYNYGYAVQPGNVTPGDTYVGWNSGMFNDNHGPHDMMNLWEGNAGEQFVSDGYFGSASHGTLFRNQLTGRNPRLQISWTAIALNRWSYHYNVVGNVLGTSVPLSKTYELSTSSSCNTGFGIYKLGFPNMGNCELTPYDGVGPTGGDARVKATLLRWGNFDYVHGAAQWDPMEVPADVAAPSTKTLPASLYLSTKPTWWPSAVAFPPIGPDVVSGQDASGHAWKTPAQICYETRSLGSGGTFSRAACYGP